MARPGDRHEPAGRTEGSDEVGQGFGANPSSAEGTDRGSGQGPARLPLCLRVLACLLIPLLYTVPGMLPGQRFLPMAPVAFAPLSLEHPEAAARARVGQSYATVDRLFPTLTDQLELRERFWKGESWLWEPDQALGLSLIGNTISGPYYPPNWLALLLPPDRAAPFLALFVLAWVALGMWAFLARLGLPDRACLIAALSLQAAGFGVANLHYGMKVDAVAWLPWCLWAILGVQRDIRGSAPLLALFLGLPFLAGFPPIAVFATVAVGAYTLATVPRQLVILFAPLGVTLAVLMILPRLATASSFLDELLLIALILGPSSLLWIALPLVTPFAARAQGEHSRWIKLKPASACAMALMLGPLLGAVQLLPTLEASGQSFRVPKDAAQLELEALSPRSWVGVPLADVYGLPTDVPAPLGAPFAWVTEDPETNSRTTQAVPLEWNTYAGVATLLLALAGVATGRRALFPLGMLLLSFGFAQAWPGVRLLYHLPGLDGGSPARALSIAWIAWAWLAGLGACALGGARRSARGVAIAGAALALTAGAWLVVREVDLGALAAGLAERYEVTAAEVERYVPAELAHAMLDNLERAGRALILGALFVGAAAIVQRGARRSRAGTLLLALAMLCEAAVFSRVHVLPRDLGGLPLFPESEAIEAVREAAGAGRVVRLDRSADGVSEVIELARPNLLHAYDIADLTPYVAFTPAGLVATMEEIEPASRFRSGVSGLHDPALLAHPWLDAAGVSCVLSLNPVTAPGLELVYERPRFHVYRRTRALTGARVVQPLDDPLGRLDLIAEGRIDLRRTTAVSWPDYHAGPFGAEPLSPPSREIDPPQREPAELPIEWLEGHRARIEVPPGISDAMAVLPASFRRATGSSGWAASGAVTDPGTLNADEGLTAARVLAAGGEVQFTYRSADARFGKWLSAAILLLLAFCGFRSWRHA